MVATLVDVNTRKRVNTILDVVHMAGDYERLTSGVFENYLKQKMPDPNMIGVSEATDWFCFSDRLNALIQHQQNYVVYPYLQYGFATWHLLFASTVWPKVAFPMQGLEVSLRSSPPSDSSKRIPNRLSLPYSIWMGRFA